MKALNLCIYLSLVLTVAACKQPSTHVDISRCIPLGNPNAPVELIVFSDFQCSFCKRAAQKISRLQKSRPAKLKVYFKHFPLQRHPFALKAAMAAEAAKLQGKFWEMHDMIFANGGNLSDETFLEIANRLNLDMKKFKRDLESKKVKAAVMKDRAEGEQIGVDGTPFFLIDKVPFHGGSSDLKRALF